MGPNNCLILAVYILFLGGCATHGQMNLAPVASRDQQIINDGGKKIIISQKRHYVQFFLYSEFSHITRSKMMFMMYFQNNGEEPVRISNNNISVIYSENGRDGESNRIDVLSSTEFMEELRKEVEEYEFRAFKSASNDILEKYRTAADLVHSSQLASGNISQNQIHADYEEIHEEFHKEMEALSTESDKVREQNRKFLEPLQQIAMKPHTVMPGKGSWSLMACDTGNIGKENEGVLEVVVSVDGEAHKFTFNLSLKNNGR